MKTRKELAARVGEMISSERNNTHGDPHKQFKTAQELKELVNPEEELEDAGGLSAPSVLYNDIQAEALDLICTKLSRIKHGQPHHQDHWLDIAGYALIAAESCPEPGEVIVTDSSLTVPGGIKKI